MLTWSHLYSYWNLQIISSIFFSYFYLYCYFTLLLVLISQAIVIYYWLQPDTACCQLYERYLPFRFSNLLPPLSQSFALLHISLACGVIKGNVFLVFDLKGKLLLLNQQIPRQSHTQGVAVRRQPGRQHFNSNCNCELQLKLKLRFRLRFWFEFELWLHLRRRHACKLHSRTWEPATHFEGRIYSCRLFTDRKCNSQIVGSAQTQIEWRLLKGSRAYLPSLCLCVCLATEQAYRKHVCRMSVSDWVWVWVWVSVCEVCCA